MSRIAVVLIALILTLSAAGPAFADGLAATVQFSNSEVSIILGYYRDHSHPQPKNGKHKKDLPPGIAKNLARGKPLPPGIAKQALPQGMLKELPPAPKGYERIAVSGRVLLVEIATQVIQDILEDALLR